MTSEAIEEIKSQAVDLFRSGLNCAEAVSQAILNYFKFDSERIKGVAMGFGGGLGRYGSVCGAVSGSVIAIGVVKNKDNQDSKDKEIRKEVYEKSLQLVEGFEKEFGSPNCRDLIGGDLRNPEDIKRLAKQNLKENLCVNLVAWCTVKTIELLQ
ncbi:MAG: C-GCAxxG-C-C family protein [Candidatus Hodarchaeota archaeon]